MACNFVKLNSGRRKESGVWQYFDYDDQSRRSKCNICTSQKVCGFLVAGKNPTNLKCHLLRHHKDEYEQITEREKSKKVTSDKVNRFDFTFS